MIDSNPIVSIIIPTYNRASFIGETLDSISSQNFRKWECLVIDDGSTDYTEELLTFYLEKDSRLSYYKRPRNRPKGANACRNYGFELSKGNFINWFDSDDVMHPQKINLQLNVFQKGNFDFCICQKRIFENPKSYDGLQTKEKLYSDDLFYDYLKMKVKWMTPSILWRKEYLKFQTSLFDEELKAAQEWEFHARIINKDPFFFVIDEELDFVRKHAISITYDFKFKRDFNYFLARLKIYQNRSLDLNEREQEFLKSYLVNSYKKMVVQKNKNALTAFRRLIIASKDFDFSAKVAALLSIFSYRIFNKGNFILQKIKFS